jgi:Relaxase/Mobilisation nuclease domain
MIAKTKANRSFRGTTQYVVEKAQARIIGGNLIGNTTVQLVKQFMISQHLNPKVKAPCYHLMLSLPRHETLTDEEFASLGERHFATVVVLSQLTGDKAKLTNPDLRISEAELNQLVDDFLESGSIHQYSLFIARHQDKEHDHIHIVASRINEVTTKVIKTWKQYPQSEFSARLLEKRFGLEQILCSWESKQKAFTRNQLERLEQDGLPGVEIIRRAIDEAVQDKPTMPILLKRLDKQGIIGEVSYQDNGKVRGIRFSINLGEVDENGNPKLLSITGGGLNRHKYSFPKLISELGVSYVPQRDDAALRETMGSSLSILNRVWSPNNFEYSAQDRDKDQQLEVSTSLKVNSESGSDAEFTSTYNSEQQKDRIKEIIETVVVNQPTFSEFIRSLQTLGVNPLVKVTRTGLIQGISFEREGKRFSGTNLGANYSWKGLQITGRVDFDLERDVKVLGKILSSNSQSASRIETQSLEVIIQLLRTNNQNIVFKPKDLEKRRGRSEVAKKGQKKTTVSKSWEME